VGRVRMVVVSVWLLGVIVYAVFYVESRLALEPYDEYARTWSFQLVAFALIRLPFLLIALALMLWLTGRYAKAKALDG
jgi:hypothetical protein